MCTLCRTWTDPGRHHGQSTVQHVCVGCILVLSAYLTTRSRLLAKLLSCDRSTPFFINRTGTSPLPSTRLVFSVGAAAVCTIAGRRSLLARPGTQGITNAVSLFGGHLMYAHKQPEATHARYRYGMHPVALHCVRTLSQFLASCSSRLRMRLLLKYGQATWCMVLGYSWLLATKVPIVTIICMYASLSPNLVAYRRRATPC